MKNKQYYVYILSNDTNKVLYTGVTGDLRRRVHQHKSGHGGGFTSKYAVNKLVYFESTNDVNEAIAREKQIKAGSRAKKTSLIEKENREWLDLAEDLFR